jgi:hypothetical protein
MAHNRRREKVKFIAAIAIVVLSLTAGVTAHAQGWGQCPAGQWCQPQVQQPDPMEAVRRQQAEAQAAHERQMEEIREQAQRQAAYEQSNRRMCTSYRTDPLTGAVTAVTQPCAY